MSLFHDADSLTDVTKTENSGGMLWHLSALMLATFALAGSIWLSLGLGLKACPLCFYQRAFVMGVIGVLQIGWLVGPRPREFAMLLALPLAASGVGVAAMHVCFELTGKLECPLGLWGIGTAPQQSLAAQSLVFVLLLTGTLRPAARAGRRGLFAVIGSLLLGAVFTWAAIAATPPPPTAPNRPYEQPLDTCRSPYHAHRG